MIQDLQVVLAILRAQSVLYQTAHWQVSGPESYSDHLLYERLYGGLSEEIDALAEKMVAHGGPQAVDAVLLEGIVKTLVDFLAKETLLAKRMLISESGLIKLLEEISGPESENSLPVGVENFLNELADNHETHVYLLKQALRLPFGRAASMAPSAEGYFFDSPKRKEVREFSDSEALSNSVHVVREALTTYEDAKKKRLFLRKVRETPPTPREILKTSPGSNSFSTLSRFLVETEDPLPKRIRKRIPDGWDDLPKQEGEPTE